MSIPIIGDIIGGLAKTVGGIIDDLTTSGEEKAAAKLALQQEANRVALALLAHEQNLVSEASQTIRAEASSDSWLTQSWRPILMLTFTAIIAINYIIVPVFGGLSFVVDQPLEIPPDMWDLLKLGVGGYVIGRSVEKGIKTWRNEPEADDE